MITKTHPVSVRAADLKAAYETLSGLQVKSLEMSPRSGTILLKKSP